VLTAEAALIEARLKAEHRWQNRTGVAERSLFAGAVDLSEIQGWRVTAGYGPEAPYSVYLELAMQQRWAILEPVMRSQWPRSARKVATAIRSAGGSA
jgi:hypothetical protein